MTVRRLSWKGQPIGNYSSPGMEFHGSVCKWYRSLTLTLAKDSAMPEGSDVYDDQDAESSDDEVDMTASPSVAMGNPDTELLDRKLPALPSSSEGGPHAAAERTAVRYSPRVKATVRRKRSKHLRSQKPDGYPSRNRYASERCSNLGVVSFAFKSHIHSPFRSPVIARIGARTTISFKVRTGPSEAGESSSRNHPVVESSHS
jgi:hypothetical protein